MEFVTILSILIDLNGCDITRRYFLFSVDTINAVTNGTHDYTQFSMIASSKDYLVFSVRVRVQNFSTLIS